MDPLRFLGLYPSALIPEHEIVAALTAGGTIPMRQVFALEDLIRYWAPETEHVLIMLIDDASLSQACKDYLARHGQAFSSMDEVVERAEAQQWPKFEVFRSLVKKNAPSSESRDDNQT